MRVESVRDYGNYVLCVLAGTGHCHCPQNPLFPVLSVDSLHCKADSSYLPARPCVYHSALCRIIGFLKLLQSDGALYLDRSVLLHLFLIILLRQLRRKRRSVGSLLPPPPPQPSFSSCMTAPYRLSATAHCMYSQLRSTSVGYP
jgi:hypothetical protein